MLGSEDLAEGVLSGKKASYCGYLARFFREKQMLTLWNVIISVSLTSTECAIRINKTRFKFFQVFINRKEIFECKNKKVF